MTHEGRMTRGKKNFHAGILDNQDTKYFLENQEKPAEEKKEKPKKSKEKK